MIHNANIMPHQMKFIGDGQQDVQLLISNTWKMIHEQGNDMLKLSLTS
jgi:hypothetical protein